MAKPKRGFSRGRFVSRSISMNEQLAGVSFRADFFFSRCLPHLDPEGRITGNAQLLKSTVAPLRPEISAKAIPDLIKELAEAVDAAGQSLVVWYEVRGTKVLWFPAFERQQAGLRKDRETPSKLPALGPGVRLLAGSSPAGVRTYGGESPAEVEGEVEGEVEAEDQAEGEGHQAPSARELLLRIVPNRRAWEAEFASALDGMHGPVATDEQIEIACRDYLANGASERPNLPHWRGHLRRVVATASRSGASGEGDALDRWAADRKRREQEAGNA